MANSRRARWYGAALLLSLGLNCFYFWNDHYDIPDFSFYPHKLTDAYFVRRHLGGELFLIEHSGHSYTVKCKDSLTWLNGIYASGQSTGEGCTYIESFVGKSIASGIMRTESGALVLQPWEQHDTMQTADVLTIVKDEKN